MSDASELVWRNKGALLQVLLVAALTVLLFLLIPKGQASQQIPQEILIKSSANLSSSSVFLFFKGNSSCTPIANVTPFSSFSYELRSFKDASLPRQGIGQRFSGKDQEGNLVSEIYSSSPSFDTRVLITVDAVSFECRNVSLEVLPRSENVSIFKQVPCAAVPGFPFAGLCMQDLVPLREETVQTGEGVFNTTRYYDPETLNSYWLSTGVSVPVQYTLSEDWVAVLYSLAEE